MLLQREDEDRWGKRAWWCAMFLNYIHKSKTRLFHILVWSFKHIYSFIYMTAPCCCFNSFTVSLISQTLISAIHDHKHIYSNGLYIEYIIMHFALITNPCVETIQPFPQYQLHSCGVRLEQAKHSTQPNLSLKKNAPNSCKKYEMDLPVLERVGY